MMVTKATAQEEGLFKIQKIKTELKVTVFQEVAHTKHLVH